MTWPKAAGWLKDFKKPTQGKPNQSKANQKSVLSKNEKSTFKKPAQCSQNENAYRKAFHSQRHLFTVKRRLCLGQTSNFFSFFRGFQFLQIPSQKGRKEKYSFSLISRLLMETSISGPNLIWIMAGSLSFPRASRVSEATAVLNYCQSVISQGSWGPLALVYILISSSRREKISLFPMCISNLPKQRIIYKGGDRQSELRNLGLMNTLCWPCW